MCIAECYDQMQLSRAQEFADGALAALVDEDENSRNFESRAMYRKALELYDISHATDIAISTGISKSRGRTLAAAILRLLRLPFVALRVRFVPTAKDWAGVRQKLQEHAKRLRDRLPDGN